MIITGTAVVLCARDWIGTPWHHQQMLKGVGADCLGLIAGVALELGIFDASPMMRDPEYRGYGKEPDPRMLDKACNEYSDRVSIRDAQLGDILGIIVPNAVYHQHFGIVSALGENGKPSRMIHSTSAQPRRVVEERIDRARWESIRRVYRLHGVKG